MNEGIYIAASAAFKQERKLDVLSNNLANLSNTGFKKDSMVFKEMIPPFRSAGGTDLSRDFLLPAHRASPNVSYVGVTGFFTNYAQGTLLQTGNPLDLALEGEGFFEIRTPQGTQYTRNGNFVRDDQGRLVTQDGGLVVGQDENPIRVDLPGAITVDGNGAVSVGRGLENVPVGRLKLVEFGNPRALLKVGNGEFVHEGPAKNLRPAQNTEVRQGFLEKANVNAVEEMATMISTLRAFEAYQKVIQSIDDADDQAVNSLGRVA